MRRLRQRLEQQAGAEHLRGLGEPELRAVFGGGDPRHARLVPARALYRLGHRQGEDCADRVAVALGDQPAQIRGGEARPRRIVHQQPIVRIDVTEHGREPIQDRVAARVAAAVKRLHFIAKGTPILAGELLIVRREHHEHCKHLRQAHRAYRVPEHRVAGEPRVLLGRPAREACAAAGRGNEREDGQSCCNSDRYNCTLPI